MIAENNSKQLMFYSEKTQIQLERILGLKRKNRRKKQKNSGQFFSDFSYFDSQIFESGKFYAEVNWPDECPFIGPLPSDHVIADFAH